MSEVKALKKISVIIREKAGIGAKDGNASFSYIHGIAVDGLSNFESAIDAAGIGDKIVLVVKADKVLEFFGSVAHNLRSIINREIGPAQLELEVEIKDIVNADNREVVAALAGATGSCGSGSDCGCGCGGHSH